MTWHSFKLKGKRLFALYLNYMFITKMSAVIQHQWNNHELIVCWDRYKCLSHFQKHQCYLCNNSTSGEKSGALQAAWVGDLILKHFLLYYPKFYSHTSRKNLIKCSHFKTTKKEKKINHMWKQRGSKHSYWTTGMSVFFSVYLQLNKNCGVMCFGNVSLEAGLK